LRNEPLDALLEQVRVVVEVAFGLLTAKT